MAKLKKERIEDTIDNHIGATLTMTDDPVFDMRLSFSLKGSPISDSRPRYSKISGHFYNPHKAEMKKLFKVIYKKDKTLKSVHINKLCKITMRLYYMPTKSFLKNVGMKNIMKEILYSIIKKDNDNVEKIHWDILADRDFQILLDDNLVVENHTYKYCSVRERVEVDIDFCSDNANVHPAYDIEIETGLTFPYSLLSPKLILEYDDFLDNELMITHLINVKDKYKLKKKKSFKNELKHLLSVYPRDALTVLAYTTDKVIGINNMLNSKLCYHKMNREEVEKVIINNVVDTDVKHITGHMVGLSNLIIKRRKEEFKNEKNKFSRGI